MCVYPEVPDWWYLSLGVVAFVIGLVVIEVFDTQVRVIDVFLCSGLLICGLQVARLGLYNIHRNIGVIPDSWWNHFSRH